MDYKRNLKYYCKLEVEEILEGKRYKYIDNGAKVLFVCHADVSNGIKNNKHFFIDNKICFSPYLDDRLGLYTIMSYIPHTHANMEYDILITTDEEIGASTAADFAQDFPDKRYNWIVEFDRKGTDVVSYQYKSTEFKQSLEEFFKVGHGSCSDITYLSSLETMSFNCGIGYHNEHNVNCYMIVNEYISQITKFSRFYYKNIKNRFEFKYKTSRKWSFDEDDEDYLGFMEGFNGKWEEDEKADYKKYC